ncbi:cell division protein FtsX [Sphingomonas sinipercae]|uniref:cell division protein FtsX n=1 Tax=Sphingomonas sinipercae TaxID=2714944 RepID=UPI0019D292B6|nr:cell division protein [Sphingomonas sinipercae]
MIASAERRLLPFEGFHLPSVAVVAIMVFAMIVVGAAGLALSRAAGAIAQGVEHRVVVQLADPSPGQLEAATRAVRKAPEVVVAEPIPEQEMRETLRRWMGDAANVTDLPVPALITLQLRPGADVAGLRKRVQDLAPGSSLVAESSELRPLLGSLRMLQWLALSLVLLIFFATAAAVVLAARGAFDTHRPTIDVMHGIGATDSQLTRLFQHKIGLDAAVGAVAGSLVAALSLLLIGGSGAAFAGDMFGTAPLGTREYAVLAALPLIAVILAVAVARWTVLRALRQNL